MTTRWHNTARRGGLALPSGRVCCTHLIAALVAAGAAAADAPDRIPHAQSAATQTVPAPNADTATLRFVSIEPTVLFVRQNGTLLQLVELTVANPAADVQATPAR